MEPTDPQPSTHDDPTSAFAALRGANLYIIAIHQHMTHEEPRMIFLHYWGRGKAVTLAAAVKTALGLTKP